MKKFVFGFVILFLLIQVGIIRGDNSTDSAVLASESSPSGSILQKLNQLKTEIASKAAEIKAEVGKTIENRAWSGIIASKNTGSFILNTGTEKRQVNVTQYTLYTTGKAKDKGSSKDLNVGDFVVAIGDVDDKNNLQAKKVIRTKSVVLNKELIWGQILKASDPTISLRTLEGNKEIATNGNTDFWLGGKEASFVDAKKDKFLLAVVEGSQSANLKAETVYFIPTVGYFKPEKMASGSAKPLSSAKSATASAKKSN